MPTVLASFPSLPLAVCFAQAETGPPAVFQFLPIVAIGLAAYLLLFRPEKDRQRKLQALVEGIKKNDRVVTSGGICGTVASVDREAGRVSLKIDDSANVKLTVTLASIAQVVPAGSDTADAST